jgi:hypothetical protein
LSQPRRDGKNGERAEWIGLEIGKHHAYLARRQRSDLVTGDMRRVRQGRSIPCDEPVSRGARERRPQHGAAMQDRPDGVPFRLDGPHHCLNVSGHQALGGR